jgi:hypothetical protein
MRLLRAPSLPVVAVLASALTAFPSAAVAQAGKFPPDSLVNVRVIPHNTPVMQLIGAMRNITFALGVRCQYCHQGQEGMPLDRFDFTSDEKRTKLVARQMLSMVDQINARLDTLPGRASPGLQVTCNTCHRGVNRPLPLGTLIADAAIAAGADSAIRAYHALREKHYGGDSYDFSEASLNTAAFRTGRAGKVDDALALLRVNEEQFPRSSGMYVFRGNILLMRPDTAAAATAFREAVRLDPTNGEAKGRLQAIGQRP